MLRDAPPGHWELLCLHTEILSILEEGYFQCMCVYAYVCMRACVRAHTMQTSSSQ